MTDDTHPSALTNLGALLEEERRALLAGDLAAIGPLLARKEALIDLLNDEPSDRQGDVASLQGKVLRNQALLDGALEGIREVAARLATFRQVRHSLDTYDKSGRKSSIPAADKHHVEKRA